MKFALTWSPEQLNALGITATQVNDQIRQFNINLPGGRSDISGVEQGIRTLGSADTVAALQSFQVVLPSGNTVPLNSLGTVKMTLLKCGSRPT